MTRSRTIAEPRSQGQVFLLTGRSPTGVDRTADEARNRRAAMMRRAWTVNPAHDPRAQRSDAAALGFDDEAVLDAATGLPGAHAFESAVAFALRDGQGGRYELAVLVVEPDGIDKLEVDMGPAAGDELLGAIAGRLSACLRRRDMLARLTRHTFGILVRDVASADDAVRVAERAIQSVRQPIRLRDAGVSLTASVGVATGGFGMGTPEVVVRKARHALERARLDGGDRWAGSAPLPHAATVTVDDLKTQLEEALDAGDLVLEFQPERRIAGAMGQAGTIRSIEALVRWRHLARGVIPPAVFLPIAEETGLIERIGSWVLHQAVAQARAWQLSDPVYRGLSVAVNLSPRELARRDLVAEVRQVLAANALEPATLTMEITEAAIEGDRSAALATLGALRAAGVRIALDDCAGGPDILNRLRDVPLDILKLDTSLVAGLGTTEADDAVRALMGAARTLGLQTVGEGVETRVQLTTLRDHGCELAQGYFFGKPLGAAGISAVLRAERRRRTDPLAGAR